MSEYRIYFLDGDGRISVADWIAADNDDDAIRVARQLKPDARKFEVWRKTQLIASITPEEPPA